MATPYSRIVPDFPPWLFAPKGRYEEHLFESTVLKGNPLGDPHRRPLWVYLPPGYDEAIGVTDVFFELFDATHDAIEYRYPIAIKYLAERLTP
jgi:hypothetical protein